MTATPVASDPDRASSAHRKRRGLPLLSRVQTWAFDYRLFWGKYRHWAEGDLNPDHLAEGFVVRSGDTPGWVTVSCHATHVSLSGAEGSAINGGLSAPVECCRASCDPPADSGPGPACRSRRPGFCRWQTSVGRGHHAPHPAGHRPRRSHPDRQRQCSHPQPVSPAVSYTHLTLPTKRIV